MCVCVSHMCTHPSYHINTLVSLLKTVCWTNLRMNGHCKLCVCVKLIVFVSVLCPVLSSVSRQIASYIPPHSVQHVAEFATIHLSFPPFLLLCFLICPHQSGMRDYTNKPIYSHFRPLIDPFTQSLDQTNISYFTLSISISASTLPYKSLQWDKVDMIMHLQWNC